MKIGKKKRKIEFPKRIIPVRRRKEEKGIPAPNWPAPVKVPVKVPEKV